MSTASTVLGDACVLYGRWRLSKKIGQGSFGEIYSGFDVNTLESVAIKLERWDVKKAALKMEASILKKMQHSHHVCRFVHFGNSEGFNFLVMEMLGENLAELRRARKDGRFSAATTARLGVQIVSAVEAIHEVGYLHRDLKPSNFAMGAGAGRREQCVMIDFGLARSFRLPGGRIRPARDIAGFRGTARYASISAHLSRWASRCFNTGNSIANIATASRRFKAVDARCPESCPLLAATEAAVSITRAICAHFE